MIDLLDRANDFYVYCLSHPDGTPFYIGKGRGNRVNDHGSARGRIAAVNAVLGEIEASGGECIRTIVRGELSEGEAFTFERDIVRAIGRRPSGPLVNQNNGGKGGSIPSAEVRQKIREARLMQRNPGREHMVEMNRRRGPWTPEQIEKVRQANLGRPKSEDQKRKQSAAMTGREMPPEVREKLIAANTGRVKSDAEKQKLRDANIGRRHSIEARQKMSAWQIGRINSAESNAKRSAALKGRKKTEAHLAAIAAARAAKKAARSGS